MAAGASAPLPAVRPMYCCHIQVIIPLFLVNQTAGRLVQRSSAVQPALGGLGFSGAALSSQDGLKAERHGSHAAGEAPAPRVPLPSAGTSGCQGLWAVCTPCTEGK